MGTMDEKWLEMFEESEKFDISDHSTYADVLGTEKSFAKYLNLTTKFVEPALRVINSGVRDVPEGKFREGLDTWRLQEGFNSYGLSVMTNGQKADKKGLDLGEVRDEHNKTYILEHYLECRFAGPILVAATQETLVPLAANDETFGVTLTLMKMMFNHNNNLAWAPDDVNNRKAALFNGTKVKRDDLTALTFQYMYAMSFKLNRLIDIVMVNATLKSDSTLWKALRLIKESPFCTNAWEKIFKQTIETNNGPVMFQIRDKPDWDSDPDMLKWTVKKYLNIST